MPKLVGITELQLNSLEIREKEVFKGNKMSSKGLRALFDIMLITRRMLDYFFFFPEMSGIGSLQFHYYNI